MCWMMQFWAKTKIWTTLVKVKLYDQKTRSDKIWNNATYLGAHVQWQGITISGGLKKEIISHRQGTRQLIVKCEQRFSHYVWSNRKSTTAHIADIFHQDEVDNQYTYVNQSSLLKMCSIIMRILEKKLCINVRRLPTPMNVAFSWLT